MNPTEEIEVNSDHIELVKTFQAGAQLKLLDGTLLGVVETPLQVVRLMKVLM